MGAGANLLTLRNRDVRHLFFFGMCLFVSAVGLAWISRYFAYGSDTAQRPIVAFVVLMTFMFAIHLLGFRAAAKLCGTRSSFGSERAMHARSAMLLIWFFAISTRVLMLPTNPIQEVDLYRYIWDGEVTAAGVSPFQHAPAQVVAAINAPNSLAGQEDSSLSSLVELCNRQPGLEQVLRRVHFAELPTVYPLVSQTVFAAVARLTPDIATIQTHVLAIKSAIVLFDLLIIAVMISVLRTANISPACAILYAWNPLVLKEFAGSGHLDSIAVFFVALTVLFSFRASKQESSAVKATVYWIAASACLGLGFGAKLFPIILLPLVLAVAFQTAKTWRLTTIRCGSMAGVFGAIAFLVLLPLASSNEDNAAAPGQSLAVASITTTPMDALEAPEIVMDDGPWPAARAVVAITQPIVPPPLHAEAIPSRSRNEGFKTFLSSWQMNDVLFAVIKENVSNDGSASDRAWYCLAPLEFRRVISRFGSQVFSCEESRASFMTARLITLVIFSAFVFWTLLQTNEIDAIELGHLFFLTIALFWTLSPTLNPWYWTWALPLLPFARSRGWWLVSGLLTIYYLRFWVQYHPDNVDLILRFAEFPTRVNGNRFFDEILVFIQHLPWMLIVTGEVALRLHARWGPKFDRNLQNLDRTIGHEKKFPIGPSPRG